MSKISVYSYGEFYEEFTKDRFRIKDFQGKEGCINYTYYDGRFHHKPDSYKVIKHIEDVLVFRDLTINMGVQTCFIFQFMKDHVYVSHEEDRDSSVYKHNNHALIYELLIRQRLPLDKAYDILVL